MVACADDTAIHTFYSVVCPVFFIAVVVVVAVFFTVLKPKLSCMSCFFKEHDID